MAVATVGMLGSASNRYGSVCGPRGLSVFALDPGETTGWAWCVVAYKELQSVWSGSLTWQQFYARLLLDSGPGGPRFACGQHAIWRGAIAGNSVAERTMAQEAHAAREIMGLIDDHSGLASIRSGGRINWVTDLVIEDFVLRERTKARNLLAPVRLTAAVAQEVLLHERLIGITVQSPSDAKSVVTDERLKDLGLWQVGQQHARDACRHLVLFLRKLNPD